MSIWLSELICFGFWVNRSGSVCLDVINQTWSPMFGKGAKYTIIYIKEKNCVNFIRIHHFVQIFTSLHFVFIFRSCECFWGVSSTTSSVSQPVRSTEWWSCSSADAWQSCLWTKGERYLVIFIPCLCTFLSVVGYMARA